MFHPPSLKKSLMWPPTGKIWRPLLYLIAARSEQPYMPHNPTVLVADATLDAQILMAGEGADIW